MSKIYKDDNIRDALEKIASKRHMFMEVARAAFKPKSASGVALRTPHLEERLGHRIANQYRMPRSAPLRSKAQEIERLELVLKNLSKKPGRRAQRRRFEAKLKQLKR